MRVKSAAPLHVIMHCEDSIIRRELSSAEDTDSLLNRTSANVCQTDGLCKNLTRVFFSKKENEESVWIRIELMKAGQ